MRRILFAMGLAFAVAGSVGVTAPVPDGPARWVTLRGSVEWPEKRRLPDPRTLPKEQVRDPDFCCSKGDVVLEEVVVNPKNRGWANVLVWLRPDSDDKNATIPKEAIHPNLLNPKSVNRVIEYKVCQIRPRVTGARAGDTLETRNPGAVADNVHVDSLETTFNVVLPPERNYRHDKPLAAGKTPILMKSDIHPWMKGYVRVFDHPYFAVTDANGRFEMPNVPVGNWRLVYWHEYGFHQGAKGRFGFPITVKDDGRGIAQLPPWEFEYAE